MCCSPGPWQGEELAHAYASADVFVFASLTDTFGLVLLEALASGVPVAAFPVSGPKDVLIEPGVGAMDWDLQAASLAALTLDRRAARAHALRYSWENSARQFIDNVLIAHQSAACPSGGPLRRWRGKRANRQKKTARLGGNRAVSFSCVSLGDALGDIRVPLEMVRAFLNVKNPPAKFARQ